jgi:hypothetical protein
VSQFDDTTSSNPNLDSIVEELSHPLEPVDILKRIKLCYQALQLSKREDEPEL